MKESGPERVESPSRLIDARIQELGDWRGEMLSRLRNLIKQADPEVVEELKWRKPSNPAGVPVWSHGGIICTGETYMNHVRLTFAKGASLKDPKGLFNAGLDGNVRRAIDIHEGDKVDEENSIGKGFRHNQKLSVTSGPWSVARSTAFVQASDIPDARAASFKSSSSVASGRPSRIASSR